MASSSSPQYKIEADLIRIFAGFAVVLIHVTDLFLLQGNLAGGISWTILDGLNIIGKVSVPFFVMLSGFLLLTKGKQLSVKQFYIKRIRRIFVPFVVWVTIYFWWMAFWGKYTVTPLFIVSSILSNSILHLYFLPLIAELYLITPLLWRYAFSRPKTFQYVITGLFFLLGIGLHLLSQYFPWVNPEHSIFTVFVPYIGYYLSGALLRNIHITKAKFFIALFFSVGAAVTLYVLRGHVVNSQFVTYLSPLVVILSVGLFILLQKMFGGISNISKNAIRAIRLFSSTILGIFLLHIIVRDVLGVIPVFNPYTIHSPILLFVVMYVCTVFFISFGIVAVVKKIPYLGTIFG